ncbi:MAG: SPFH domain-containing protein [Spirosomaceae bacterium]|jgi:regulator of protease activity HflC (stomatin/prohibitin superfamily)|nr:SPFH domain-containing protein [Spirosomataceae bacterium]
MKIKNIGLAIVIGITMSSCAIIRQGEVGVKRTLGKISPVTIEQGAKFYFPLGTTILKVPVRTVNIEVKPDLPSKEGLTINTEISILYRLKPETVPVVVDKIGLGFENEVILPIFRSASADVSSKFYAKDLHSGERAVIEKAIKDQMNTILEPRGIVIENVLLKSIRLPAGLARSIEEKLQAEVDAQRMEFVKERQKREAERSIIEAEGKKEIAKVQAEGEKNAKIIAAEALKRSIEIEAEGRANALKVETEAQAQANEWLNKTLTPSILKYKQIDAFRVLSNSPNSKVILTDGKTPFLGLPQNTIE